jgi:diaminohydroxyphosphoribosylaminopyrimidine deaminase/5-amino-6-(5-phosphoribosylamino)uracil reductase
VVDRILACADPARRPVTLVGDVGVSTIFKALRWKFDGVDPDLLLSLVPT